MRRAARTDRNQTEIVTALRKVGAKVYSLAAVGCGLPDLLVAFRGDTVILELKDGTKPPSARQLTDDQIKFHAEWTGGPLFIVNSVGEALAAIGVSA